MVKRKIIWTATAARQRRLVLQYWKDRNKSTVYSEKLIALTAEHIRVIAINPEAFKESELPGIRESAMGHFSIFYTCSESEIIVMAFWDNRQDPKKLLKALTD
jgi:plasmid stabilization system protein ParE